MSFCHLVLATLLPAYLLVFTLFPVILEALLGKKLLRVGMNHVSLYAGAHSRSPNLMVHTRETLLTAPYSDCDVWERGIQLLLRTQ